jgi:hypothetical protein
MQKKIVISTQQTQQLTQKLIKRKNQLETRQDFE